MKFGYIQEDAKALKEESSSMYKPGHKSADSHRTFFLEPVEFMGWYDETDTKEFFVTTYKTNELKFPVEKTLIVRMSKFTNIKM